MVQNYLVSYRAVLRRQIPVSRLERIATVVESYSRIKVLLCIPMRTFNLQKHCLIFYWRRMTQMVRDRKHAINKR